MEGEKDARKKGVKVRLIFFSREPDRILRRTIRCMLPFHTARGREAFRNLRVYKSVPAELKGKKFEKPAGRKLETSKIEIGELSVRLGARKLW